MKKIYFACLLILILTLPLKICVAEVLSPDIKFSEDSELRKIQFSTDQTIRLMTLHQELNPAKLILIFESKADWQNQELAINQAPISKLKLLKLELSKYFLEVEFTSVAVPEFELKNQVGNFQIIFPVEAELKSKESSNNLAETEKKTETSSLNSEVISSKELPKTSQAILSEQLSEANEAVPAPIEQATPEIIAAPQGSQTLQGSSPELINVLHQIEFKSSELENYLLLGISPKPNFSYNLNKKNEYEIIIPDFQLAATHLAHTFYAPQQIPGFLSVTAKDSQVEDQQNLIITIRTEEYFQLKLVPIPEGIKVLASTIE